MTFTGPASPDRPPLSSVDSLLNHLRSLNITDSVTASGDTYLSAEAIDVALEGMPVSLWHGIDNY